MDRDTVRAILENGDCIDYHAWAFTKYGYCCGSDCCNDTFDDIEDALDTIFYFVGDDWDEVEVV